MFKDCGNAGGPTVFFVELANASEAMISAAQQRLQAELPCLYRLVVEYWELHWLYSSDQRTGERPW
jgi:hypothetical protein